MIDHATHDVTQIAPREAWLADERAKWLTRAEAAYVLGTSVTKIDKLLRKGLKHRQEGRLIRIHLDDLRP